VSGGADSNDDDGGMIEGINVTPLVDIVLVLLIIFMVTARFIVTKAIPVQTPKAASGDEVATTLGLTIDASRNLYLNGEKTSDKQAIEDALRKAASKDPNVQAVITADVSVPHGEVIALIDTIRVAGVVNFALTVEQSDAPAPGTDTAPPGVPPATPAPAPAPAPATAPAGGSPVP
jgi:biopolymer transport protein ExbD